jgi:hypothetical protein
MLGSGQTENGETAEQQSQERSLLITFFGIKEIVHKEFVLEGQTLDSGY